MSYSPRTVIKQRGGLLYSTQNRLFYKTAACATYSTRVANAL